MSKKSGNTREKSKYICAVRLANNQTAWYHSNNLKTFQDFIDAKFQWKWVNVLDGKSKIMIGSFTKNDRELKNER